MTGFEIAFELTLAGIATLIAMGSAKLYANIKSNEQQVMTKFKLKSSETYRDFQLFIVGEFLLLITFLCYPVALTTHNQALLMAARITLLAFVSLIMIGILRMWRRSK